MPIMQLELNAINRRLEEQVKEKRITGALLTKSGKGWA